MKRDLDRLARETFDLIVIGGGVYGLSTAWDAALRGMRVAVLERGDFGQETSSASLKLIHGGLRYLQHLDFGRMRVSIRERRWMLNMAQHLVRPLKFVLPCYGHGLKGPEAMRAALLVNDVVSWDRNRELAPEQHIPRGRIVSKQRCLEMLPGLPDKGLTGAAVFHDAQIYNSERLTLSFGLSAAHQGAALANYLEVKGFETRHERIIAVQALDRFSGETVRVAGRFFVNMTGPWSDIVAQLLRTSSPSRVVLRSKGVQILTRSIDSGCAFAVESRQKDSSAVLQRGGRNYFITPWRGMSLIGTTDTVFQGDPNHFRITKQDIMEFIAEINAAYPPARLTMDDVRFWIGGLRPVGDVAGGSQTAAASHRYQIIDHTREGVENFLSVVGVKYTICRDIAERVVDMVLSKSSQRERPGRTSRTPLLGGGFESFASLCNQAEPRKWEVPGTVQRLAHNYGTLMGSVLNIARDRPELATPIHGSSGVLKAEVVYSVRHEMAMKLSDVVLRRTDLATHGHPGAQALAECCALMTEEFGWNVERQDAEISEVEKLLMLPETNEAIC